MESEMEAAESEAEYAAEQQIEEELGAESPRVDPEEPPPHIEGQMGFTEAPPEPDAEGRIWKGSELLAEHLAPIGELKPFPGNARRGDVPTIARSLARFGQVRAVLTTPDGVVVAGNHTMKAAASLGWTHVAAMPAVFESDGEAAAYNIADNETAIKGEMLDVAQQDLMEFVLEETGTAEGTGISLEEIKMRRAWLNQVETMRVDELTDHQRNPRGLTTEQLKHEVARLKEAGLVRNVVVARDGTVLAGHEIVEAAREVGWTQLPVQRRDIDPNDPEALKIIAADSELAKIGRLDDYQMAEVLKEIKETGDVEALVGTGHTAETLAAMVMVTRPKSEVKDADAAKEWVGLPEFEPSPELHKVVISCDTEEQRDALIEELGLIIHYKRERSWSAPWPPRKRDDLKHLRFEG